MAEQRRSLWMVKIYSAMYQLILASNSPRRRELLAGLDVPFEVKVLQGIDESYPADTPVGEVPVFIAKAKAEAYRGCINDDQLDPSGDYGGLSHHHHQAALSVGGFRCDVQGIHR